MIILPDGSSLDLQSEIAGTVNPSNLISKLGSELKSSCDAFLDSPACVNSSVESVHVVQGEFAEISLSHKRTVKVVGSSDATTCVIVFVIDQSSRRAVVCHHDESTIRTLDNITQGIIPGMISPELYLVGGALTGSNNGDTVSLITVLTLLEAFHSLSLDIKLNLFCALEWNTDPLTRSPRCQSLAVSLSQHKGTYAAVAFAVPPGGWQSKGPLLIPRLAQIWLDYDRNKRMRSVYDPEKGYWVIKLLKGACSSALLPEDNDEEEIKNANLNTLHSSTQLNFSRLLNLPDTELLYCCSTSPECELPHMAGEIRRCLQWAMEQPALQLVEHRLIFNKDSKHWDELCI